MLTTRSLVTVAAESSFPAALYAAIVATEARVGVTGIMAVLMEFKMADKNKYFFSCFLISAKFRERDAHYSRYLAKTAC